MTGYLRRLATTGAAYTASSVISKLIAVALLPLYTRYLTPADYGAADAGHRRDRGEHRDPAGDHRGAAALLLRGWGGPGRGGADVVRVAVLVSDDRRGAPDRVRRADLELLLDRSDPGLVRIAIFGLWVFTMYEFLLALFRLDERAKAFLAFTVANVLVTIPVTVWLVVVEDEGARGLLLGQYATGAVFLVPAADRSASSHRVDARLGAAPPAHSLRLPTMPAELSLYSLNFIDRVLIVRLVGLADAGLYSLSVKFAQAVNVLVKGSSSPGPRSRTRSGTTTRRAAPTR
jgi:hypothetical protein